MTQIVVPTLGESVSEATVANWLKKEGDMVKADEPVVELETGRTRVCDRGVSGRSRQLALTKP